MKQDLENLEKSMKKAQVDRPMSKPAENILAQERAKGPKGPKDLEWKEMTLENVGGKFQIQSFGESYKSPRFSATPEKAEEARKCIEILRGKTADGSALNLTLENILKGSTLDEELGKWK